MYWLLGIDTVVRIAAAMALLFLVVPALAWPRPASFGRLEWFWWNFGVGIAILTIAGEIFTLFNIAGPLPYAALLVAIVVVCRARRRGVSPLKLVKHGYHRCVLFALKLIDRNASRASAQQDPETARPLSARIAGLKSGLHYVAVIVVAAIIRFYRPFATANLGFSDTYVHLYLMRLLDQGRQVDPAWGPYPRGMHFLLLAIERLTNADPILMMNFFGAFAGVLMTLSVAYAARRIARSNVAALVAGLVFATMIGGARQYFVLGGSVSANDAAVARVELTKPYAALANAGEFDVLLTAFERQTSTLPQELAIVLLFPAALFLLDWLRTRDRWKLAGYVGCTAAIAAIHSGVVVPLVLMCGAAWLAVILSRPSSPPLLRTGSDGEGPRDAPSRRRSFAALRRLRMTVGYGALGVALGSTWLIGFLFYRRVGTQETISATSHAGSTALYYFPFLRPFVRGANPDIPTETAYMMLTPFLIAMLLVALFVAWRAADRPKAMWVALTLAIFTLTHAASIIGIPEIVEVRRNATWLAMAIAVVIGVAAVAVRDAVPLRVARAIPALIAIAWATTVPNLFAATFRSKLLDYSGYGGTTYAVLLMSHELQPFTWTLISYGQEYPMVLGRGFHLNGADFLEQYDPAAPLRIPTPYVFIAVEKRPHRFQINAWSTRFDRAAVEERLQTWCTLYRMSHHDMRVFLDDPNVRVYEIARSGTPPSPAAGQAASRRLAETTP